MEKNRSRFTKWFVPNLVTVKSVDRSKSVKTRNTKKTVVINDISEIKTKCQSLSRHDSINSNDSSDSQSNKSQSFDNMQVYSSLQPEIYSSLDSLVSEMDSQSLLSSVSSSQEVLVNIRKELIIRTNGVSLAFEILETIFTTCLQYFPENSEPMIHIERIFKDMSCMSNFHHLYQRELNEVIRQDLPLSNVFTNQVINSALNWYKIFYTTFETRSQLISSLYNQNVQFKAIADKAIILHTQKSSEQHLRNFPWILNSMKDSLFHFEVLLSRYSDCLDDPLEKSRINDAMKLLQNILRSCNMQCDYNDFIKTQQEYSLLSTSEPLSPNLRFIYKGAVQKLCQNGLKLRQRIIFLFTHMIYITKKAVQFNSYRITNQISLSMCNFYVLAAEKFHFNKKGFRLESGEFTREFLLDNDEQFKVWIEMLRSTICQARLRKKSFDKKMIKISNSEISEKKQYIDLGFETPIFQKFDNTNFCNGFACSKRFHNDQSKNICGSDGLLYCPECLSYSVNLSYCNVARPVCKECYEIISQPDCRSKAIDRQNTKLRRIQRHGVITGWLLISKISQIYIDSVEMSEKLFCVLNCDCILYSYESPQDKYHKLPLRLLRATFSTDSGLVNGSIKITRNDYSYVLEADSPEETLKWIQAIKLTQLENLEKI